MHLLMTKCFLIQSRHIPQKLAAFVIRIPAARYQTASFTLHHVRTLAGILLFREPNHLSRAARTNEFLAVYRIPGRKLNLRHATILRYGAKLARKTGTSLDLVKALIGLALLEEKYHDYRSASA